MNIIPDSIIRRLNKNPQHFSRLVRLSAFFNRVGVYFLKQGRLPLAAIYPDGRYTPDQDFIASCDALQGKVSEVLKRYQADPDVYKYFYGQPYQGLAIAGIFGDRLSDYRFDDYELRSFIRDGDKVLDIGCNCGFIGLLACYRTGCHVTGIDINPYMIEIGKLAAEHLRIDHLADLKSGTLQDFDPGPIHDVVLSFATHWTDDENYRVSLNEHMDRMASYLRPGGLLVFETHCNDVGNTDFYEMMDSVKDRFEFDGLHKKTDSDTRELYVMKRR